MIFFVLGTILAIPALGLCWVAQYKQLVIAQKMRGKFISEPVGKRAYRRMWRGGIPGYVLLVISALLFGCGFLFG